MRKAFVAVGCVIALFSMLSAQGIKGGGSLTVGLGVQTSSTGVQLLGIGAGITLFPVRYFGGGADLVYGMKSYSQEATQGSLTQKATIDAKSLAIDGYFAPHIDFDRGRLYPIAGLTIYNFKLESSSGGVTTKYDYGTNVGFVFGLGAEVIVKKQIVLGIKMKNRLVIGKEETTESGVKTTTDTPIGGPEGIFTIGLNF